MPTFALALFRFFSHWPLSVLHGLGAWLGRLVYLLSPTYRRHLQENLFLAMGEARGRQVLPAAVAAAGRATLELPKVWMRPQPEVASLVVRTTGWELADQARANGEGIIFLTPHMGCFEIAAHYQAIHGGPITVLYRQPRKNWLRPLIEAGRGSGKLKLAPADVSGVRNLVKALRKREAVGILPDQVPGAGEGVVADFFGKPAWTMTLAARLSEVSGVRVLFAFAERLPHGEGFHLHISLPSEPLVGTLEQKVVAINREMERLILGCPEQYLWGYNRYKNLPPGQ